jgi:hypothetical protein
MKQLILTGLFLQQISSGKESEALPTKTFGRFHTSMCLFVLSIKSTMKHIPFAVKKAEAYSNKAIEVAEEIKPLGILAQPELFMRDFAVRIG